MTLAGRRRTKVSSRGGLLQGVMRRWLRDGEIALRLPDERVLTAGGATLETSPLVVRVVDPALTLKMLWNAPLLFGEAYVDGGFVIERGDVYDLLTLVARNLRSQPKPGRFGALLRWATSRVRLSDPKRAARRNVSHHYDKPLEFYRRFLDEDLQYSCAYFGRPDMSLEEAQLAKKRRLIAKLHLRPGMSVLDIGCGWGGLGLTLAQEAQAAVTGITLSTEQLSVARRRAQDRGLADRARFELVDYRDVEGPYDRIVSVGMFEHVGPEHYRRYFEGVARLLKDDGVAVVHSIGRSTPPRPQQPWIAKHVFPGGYIPSLSEVLPAIEAAGLMITDVEILRLHYAETIRHWRARFQAQRAEIAGLYDERFCRLWEFYLAASEVAFRLNWHMVFQVQLTKRVDAVPITRDYMSSPGAPET